MTRPRGDPPLHDLEPTRRFTDRAADYVRFRPDYPAAAIDCILAGLVPGEPAAGGSAPRAPIAADVGAGTGISARQLAARGVRVVAVEPNAAMRAAAEPHPLVAWREGTAEATGLGAESADLLLCAQAFHWFRQREAVAEFHRILRPGGRLVIMWNNRDSGDALTRDYIEAIRAVNGEHAIERREFDPAVVHVDGLFTPPRLESFEHAQELDLPGLIGRATSASYVPREGPAFSDLRERLTTLFERHHDARGRVRLKYRTRLHLTERR